MFAKSLKKVLNLIILYMHLNKKIKILKKIYI